MEQNPRSEERGEAPSVRLLILMDRQRDGERKADVRLQFITKALDKLAELSKVAARQGNCTAK